MAKVHMVVNKIWRYGELESKVDVYEVNARTMRFRISNPKAREKILKRGMWNIAGVLMVVTKWAPKIEEEKQEEDSIPMWVHLRKVPLHMYSWEGISFMTSTVGFPDTLHPETIACTNLEVAKVFVNVDITKSLPKEIDFEKGGKEFTVEFHYPWLPAKCSKCSKWGHTERVCAMNGKDKKKKEMLVQSEGGSEIQKEVLDDITERKEEQRVQDTPEKKGVENEKREEENGLNWSMVSPAKAGRSHLSQENATDIQISDSKYSVLSTDVSGENEEGEILGEDHDNEEEEVRVMNEIRESEEDQLEEDILAQQDKARSRAEIQKGARRGPKPKAMDVNPSKSTRPSRKKN